MAKRASLKAYPYGHHILGYILIILTIGASGTWADPGVVRVLAPDETSEHFDDYTIDREVVYNSEVNQTSIDVQDIQVVGISEYAVGNSIPVVEVKSITATETELQVVYTIGPVDGYYNGDYEIRIVENQVHGTGDPPPAIAPGVIATFKLQVAHFPELLLRGRSFLDTADPDDPVNPKEPSLEDDGWEEDPGLDVTAALEFFSDGVWEDQGYTQILNDVVEEALGTFEFRINQYGLYRIRNVVFIDDPDHAEAIPVWPEWVVQAVGDPTREGQPKDGYRYFEFTRDWDKQTTTVNFSYVEEQESPEAVADGPNSDLQFRIPGSSDQVQFDVLKNDTVDGRSPEPGELTIIGVSSYFGLSTQTADMTQLDWADEISEISTDGNYVYYTPARFVQFFKYEEESFYYTIEDSEGNRDFAKVRVILTYGSSEPIVAVDDSATVGMENTNTKINVLENDEIQAPLTKADLTITEVGVPTNGGTAFFQGPYVYYTPPQDFSEDTFSYTITDGVNAFSTATVRVRSVNDIPPIADDRRALLFAMLGLFQGTSLGHDLQDLLFQHRAELMYLLVDQGTQNTAARVDGQPLAYGQTLTLQSPGTSETEEKVLDLFSMLEPGFSAVLAGNGDEVVITEEIVSRIRELKQIVYQSASPQLKADIENNPIMPLDNFVGKTISESIELLGADPNALSVVAWNPELKEGKFSITTYRAAGLLYKLWKTATLAPESWQEVENMEIAEEGLYKTLTDPSPDTQRTFYRISGDVD